jgi:hypothetical protein
LDCGSAIATAGRCRGCILIRRDMLERIGGLRRSEAS